MRGATVEGKSVNGVRVKEESRERLSPSKIFAAKQADT